MTTIHYGPRDHADVDQFLSKNGRNARERWEVGDSLSLQVHEYDPQHFASTGSWRLFGKENVGTPWSNMAIGNEIAADHAVITSWRASVTGVPDRVLETSANDSVRLIIGDRDQDVSTVPNLLHRPWKIGPFWVPPRQSVGVSVYLSPKTIAAWRQTSYATDARLWIHVEFWT